MRVKTNRIRVFLSLGVLLLAASQAFSSPTCPGGRCSLAPEYPSSGFSAGSSLYGNSVSSLPPFRTEFAPPLPSIVRIVVENAQIQSCGTGTWIQVSESQCAILTCAHLFETNRPERITVCFPNLPALEARIQAIDREWDVALLRTSAGTSFKFPQPIQPTLTPAKPGEFLRVCGYGSEGKTLWMLGAVRGYTRLSGTSASHTLVTVGAARPGDSGSPFLTLDGKLAGVLWGTDGQSLYGTWSGQIFQALKGSVQNQPFAFPSYQTSPLSQTSPMHQIFPLTASSIRKTDFSEINSVLPEGFQDLLPPYVTRKNEKSKEEEKNEEKEEKQKKKENVDSWTDEERVRHSGRFRPRLGKSVSSAEGEVSVVPESSFGKGVSVVPEKEEEESEMVSVVPAECVEDEKDGSSTKFVQENGTEITQNRIFRPFQHQRKNSGSGESANLDGEESSTGICEKKPQDSKNSSRKSGTSDHSVQTVKPSFPLGLLLLYLGAWILPVSIVYVMVQKNSRTESL